MNPFLNALTAAGFAASGVTVSSQLLKNCPCSIMPCSSCKADGNLVPLWQTHFAAQLKPSHGVYFICGDKAYLSLPPFWSGTCFLGHVTPHIDLAWSNTSLPLPVYTQFMGPVITILLGLLFGPCILQLLTKFISSRLQQFQAKLMLLQGWKLVSDVEHPNLDQIERDFCSARQAYTHAQQEEVTEGRDLCPNSQEVS